MILPGFVFIKKYFIIFLLITINFYIVSGYSTSLWFNHLLLDSFNFKINILVSFTFFISLIFTMHNNLFLNSSVINFLSSIINLFIWIFFIFLSSNILSFIFLLEMISASVTTLTVSSFFFINFKFSKLKLTYNNYFFLNISFYKVSSIMYFFWTSFLTSINLFFFLLIFNYYFYTLDLVFFNHLLSFNLNFFSYSNIIVYFFIVFLFLFIIFLKCGLVPFFLWKPNFFKGLSFYYISFYTVFYYFFLLFFFLTFLSKYFISFIEFFSVILILLIFIGLFFLMTSLFSISYLKSFFAYSSILNTLFFFFLLITSNSSIFSFF